MSKSKDTNEINEAISIVASDIPNILHMHERELEWQLKTKGNRLGLQTPYFVSEPGIGKSMLNMQVAESMGRIFIDIRAGNYIPSDVRLPSVDRERDVARYVGNEEFPFLREGIDPDGRYFIHSDEMGDASGVMHKMMKQIINDNCLGNLKLPENTLHAASANGLAHGCQSERMPFSNANRYVFYHIQPDVDGWMKWLEKIGMYPELFAFMKGNADIPYDYDLATWDGESNFASFRSLENIGKLFESNYVETDSNGRRTFKRPSEDPMFLPRVAGGIGYKAAKALIAWLEVYETVGSIDKLLADPDNCTIPSDDTTKWIIATRLVGEATEDTVDACMKVAYRLTGKKGFMAAYVAKAITKTKPNLVSNSAIVKWMKENTMEVVGRG